jgi:hypothetical protein
MDKKEKIALQIGLMLLIAGGIFWLTGFTSLEKQTADRFAGSEMVFVMDKLAEQGVCIDYNINEVADLYEGKLLSERKVFQGMVEGKWKCE